MAYLEQFDGTAAMEISPSQVLDDLTLARMYGTDRENTAMPPRTRIVVHIVAAEQTDRAHLARVIFSAGHHAEVYSDTEEFLSHRPKDGVALIGEGTAHTSASLIEALTNAGTWLPVIGFGKDLSFDCVIAGTKAGVTDYVVGEIERDILVPKLEAADATGREIRQSQMHKARARLLISSLSPRERQVLDRLAQGSSNKTMARELSISPRTVEIHRMKMMSKLGAKTSAEAIRLRLQAFEIV